MEISFLSSAHPLTKKYTKLPDGNIQKDSYLNAADFTSHTENIDDVEALHEAIVAHAELGHCLIKGKLNRELNAQSRARSTDSIEASSWICLDIDGLPAGPTIDELLLSMGLGFTSYVLQYSASQNIFDDSLRCHIFMLLSKPVAAPLLKQWLMQVNFLTPCLRANIALTKTGTALSWPLDVTACQNDKLLYITKPLLVNIRNPLGRMPRYSVHVRRHSHLTFPEIVNSIEENKRQSLDTLNRLRETAKLPPRKFVTKIVKDVEVLSKPDQAMVTGMKRDRGFVYLNLNGGDSWGYYHPDDAPEIIFNFKSEPAYATKELLPDYYKEAVEHAKQAKQDNAATQDLGHFTPTDKTKPLLLAFRDKSTGVYYQGEYTESTEHLDLFVAKNEKQVRDFCMQNAMPMGDYIPIWDVRFDPLDTARVDVENRYVNTFERTEYMRNVDTSRSKNGNKTYRRCPPVTFKLIHHVLGNEPELTAHFMNWLAWIVQTRTRTDTAWLLYGTEGCGKGLLFKKVLKPLFGHNHVTMNRVDELEGSFNAFMQQKLIVFFDEVEIPKLRDADTVLAKLRNVITEEFISMRAMYSGAVNIPNYANIILASNKTNAVPMSSNDRRYNIGRFQHDKLELTPEEDGVIDSYSELQEFYDYLYNLVIDREAVRKPLVSQDRANLIATTSSSADDVADALVGKKPSMTFFLDLLPSNPVQRNALLMNAVEDYKLVLLTLLRRRRTADLCNVSRDELHTLFDYTVGGMSNSPHKFTKYLRHHHIETKKIRIEEQLGYGIQVKWSDADKFDEYLTDYFPELKKAMKK